MHMHASIPNHRALHGNGAHDESESEEALASPPVAAAAAAAVAVASAVAAASAAAVAAAAGGCDPPAELFVPIESPPRDRPRKKNRLLKKPSWTSRIHAMQPRTLYKLIACTHNTAIMLPHI